jgi:hypothetical protein
VGNLYQKNSSVNGAAGAYVLRNDQFLPARSPNKFFSLKITIQFKIDPLSVPFVETVAIQSRFNKQ